MNAWNIDANTIDTGDIGGDFSNLMVVTRDIRDFLGTDTKKMFIVAPKGIGKTFLLKVKSQQMRDAGLGYKFIPEGSLCESFTSNDLSLSENDIQKFSERSIWYKTWELCLYTLILKQFKNSELPKEIINAVGDDTGVLSEVLGAFLHQRGRIEKLHSLVAIKLKPAVRKLRENSTANQIAVFIDNIDESFDSFVGFTAQSDGKIKGASIWINAQVALLSVARDICRSNSHIKIFATIRSEAYNNFQDPIKLQIDELCVFLKYTKEDLKEIFVKNIKLTASEDLVLKDDPNPFINFFGYDKVPHKFIWDEKGERRMEDIFEFIYRHSYARPRDIMLMGQSIAKVPPAKRLDTNLVGSMINEQSYRLFSQLKDETIPVFEEDIFEQFCIRVKSNVIKYDEVYKISQSFKEEGFSNIFSYFYRLGLIGVVESDLYNNSETLKQTFLPVGQYSLTNEPIPEYQYFVLHPSLNKKMKQIYDVGFYDRFNIIGYDYPFSASKINLIDNHFHFGLDRDSITSIIPVIHSTKCLAALVLPSAEWSDLEHSNSLIINVNGLDTSFRVYNENLNEQEKNEIKKDWKEKKYHVVIYTNYIEEISYFFDHCISFSFSLYLPHADIMHRLLNNIESPNPLIFYICREYAEQEFEYISSKIKSSKNGAVIELVLTDRFQFSLELQHNVEDEVLKCSITAESKYNIIYKKGPNSLFSGNDRLLKLHTDTEMQFYKMRQSLIVEGIYHIIKVLFSKGRSDENEYQPVAQTFLLLQCNRLLSKYSDDLIHNLFNGKSRDIVKKELIKFGNETIIRIKKLYDDGVLATTEHDLIDNKEKNLFPSDDEFYRFCKSTTDFYQNSNVFLDLKNILELNPLPNHRKVFISYSSDDSEIVNTFYERLMLMGIDAQLYERDLPLGSNKVYMDKMVREADRMLFFASINSFRSDACHIELKKSIEMIRQMNDPNRIIVIRLDDYLITEDLLNVTDEDRRSNILFLKDKIGVGNSFLHKDPYPLRKVDELLNKIVDKSIRIGN